MNNQTKTSGVLFLRPSRKGCTAGVEPALRRGLPYVTVLLVMFCRSSILPMASPLQPQQGFCRRVPNLGHPHLHLVQHDLLQRGERLLVGYILLIHLLQEKQGRSTSKKRSSTVLRLSSWSSGPLRNQNK